MDAVSARRRAMKRIRGRTLAWLTKPANIVLLVFAVALTVLTLYPLLSLCAETLTIHPGREARAAQQTAGDLSLYHFQRLFFFFLLFFFFAEVPST